MRRVPAAFACALAVEACASPVAGPTRAAPSLANERAATQEPRATSSSLGAAAGKWRTPAGFKNETIPFPLEFAPSLAHKGVEELRFAPGFFDKRAPGYFTYAFVWRIEEKPSWPDVARELEAYFRGLMTEVAAGKKRPLDANARFTAKLATANEDGGTVAVGHVTTVDAFSGGDAVELELRAVRKACPKGALYAFAMAPLGALKNEHGTTAVALTDEATCEMF